MENIPIGIPQVIQVERKGRVGTVTIDGIPFPYAIDRSEIAVAVHPDRAPTVTLTLLADRVEVVNSLDDEGGE